MITRHAVSGYLNFQELIAGIKSNHILILFCGSLTEGRSWCSDCVAAEPVIEKVLKQQGSKKDFDFIHVEVGTREEWKNPQCPFRTDSKLKLTSVPTLLHWGTQHRLNDSECQNEENISMMLEDI